jgi:hypothetical protein
MNSLPYRGFETGELWEHRSPFRHFRGMNVLPRSQFSTLESEFQKILESSELDPSGKYRMSRGAANYDAFMLPMDTTLASKFYPLFSESFIGSLHDLIGLPFLNRIDGAVHSSPQGSRTGWIHTDHCSAWFDKSVETHGDFQFPDRNRVTYFDGRLKAQGALPVEYVRAATMIFYCCNAGWKRGDGGETALYATPKFSMADEDLVPPLSNTFLLFECSPHSYHRFITNPGRPRNSIILWLHSTPEHVESRWGASAHNRRGPK